jgi:hypothetical protein
MGVENSEMRTSSREVTAQHHRQRAQQLRELAVTMASDVDRKDIEWVADRYEALAMAAEIPGNSEDISPVYLAMLRPFQGRGSQL